MPELYDVAAPKKATNVSLNSDLLQIIGIYIFYKILKYSCLLQFKLMDI